VNYLDALFLFSDKSLDMKKYKGYNLSVQLMVSYILELLFHLLNERGYDERKANFGSATGGGFKTDPT
jgi:hypothetical protein